jgi:hypothetical protein
MADRYWVGGTGTWSSTSKWSTSSGGSSGASIPTSADDVYIDSNSGFGSGGTITLGLSNVNAKNLTLNSGHTYTLTGTSGMFVYGSIYLESGITFTPKFLTFYGTSTGLTITTNGVTLPSISFYGENGEYTLQDNINCSGLIDIGDSTFYANDYNLTAVKGFYFESGDASVNIHMGSGTWTITGSDYGMFIDDWGDNVTIYPDTSTIKFTDSTATAKAFRGGGKNYYNVWFSGTGTGVYKIYESNTFNEIKIDAGLTLQIESGTTQTVESFDAIGTSDDPIILDKIPLSGASNFTLSKPDGQVDCEYLEITNSTAGGGTSVWTAFDSVDGGSNTGWLFSLIAHDTITGVTVVGPDAYKSEKVIFPDTVQSLSWSNPDVVITAIRNVSLTDTVSSASFVSSSFSTTVGDGISVVLNIDSITTTNPNPLITAGTGVSVAPTIETTTIANPDAAIIEGAGVSAEDPLVGTDFNITDVSVTTGDGVTTSVDADSLEFGVFSETISVGTGAVFDVDVGVLQFTQLSQDVTVVYRWSDPRTTQTGWSSSAVADTDWSEAESRETGWQEV